MSILFVSTHQVTCGIADYNSDMMKAAGKHYDYDIEPLPQNGGAKKADLSRIADRARAYDCVVIQHEWSFFGGTHYEHYEYLRYFLKRLRKNNVPTAMIMHTRFTELRAIRLTSPHGIEDFRLKLARRLLIREINRSPLLRIFVHSKKFSEHLAKHTIRTDKFESLPFPLQVYPERTPKPAKESGDTVTLLMFGFLSAYKGYEAALNALRLLPDNFRLVFAGGQHPSNPHDITFENILAFLHQGVWLHHRQIPPVGEVFTPEEHRAFETRVELTGHLPTAEITKAIDKADIVLAPYLLGGSPAGSAAVAWPISLGKPTIVSSAHTFDDYIEANCVIAVTPGASYHLARAIKALASDPDEMQRLSAAALAFARQNSVEATSLKILNKMQALRPRSVVKKEISQPATP